MKVYISISIEDNSKGGGVNFLRYLSKYLDNQELLTSDYRLADIILINSHHNVFKNLLLKFLYPKKIYVHRIDGRISNHRPGKYWDKIIEIQNKYISNSTIYQSLWSKIEWQKQLSSINYKIIHNRADPEIFNCNQPKILSNTPKLIFVSWSNNPNKGRTYLNYLIKNRKPNQYELKIVGNLTVANLDAPKLVINHREIARQYHESDIFVFPAENESCSNALIEAQACGLPILALNSGGNPEIVLKSGIIFNNEIEMMAGIERICSNYVSYSLEALELTKARETEKVYKEYFLNQIKVGPSSNRFQRFKLIQAFLLILMASIEKHLN